MTDPAAGSGPPPDGTTPTLDAGALLVLARIPDAVALHRAGCVVFANRAAARLLGVVDPAALLGTRSLGWVEPGSRAAVVSVIRAALGGADDGVLAEASLAGVKTGPIDVRFSIHPVQYEDAPALLTVLRDVSGERAAIDALRESEQRYRALVDLSPEAFWVNVDGCLAFANAACARLLGAPNPEALTGRSIFKIIHPRYHDAVRDRMSKVLAEGCTVDLLEEEIVRLDGRAVPVEIIAGPITFGGARGLMVMARDIGARKRAEASAVAWKRSYESLLQTSRQLFYEWDVSAEFVQFAGNVRALFGCDERALAGSPERWLARIHPDDAGRYREAVARLREGGGALHIEYRVRHADGSWLVVEDDGALLRNAAESSARIVGVLSDVTERSTAQEALRESEARAHAILDAAPDAIVTLDESGAIESLNPGAERMFGLRSADVVGRSFSPFLVSLSREAGDDVPMPCLDRLTGRGHEATGRRKDGREFPVQLGVSEVRLSNRRIFMALLHDLTEQKALEAQLRHAQKMEAVGLLAGGVAHDFNNLLLTVQGRTELLLAGLDEVHPMRRQVQEIQAAAERAAHLTRQLLAFSRRQPLRPRVVDVNALVLDLADMLRRLIGEDVELALHLDPALGRVRADPGVLDQVVMNLVLNARDAMPSGGCVTLETTNVDRGGVSRVALSIRDTGLGMDAATQARIFEPYFTTKEPGRGTGLGLSTVDGIVRQSGGEIEVSSVVGRGSTFRILLPRTEDALEAAAPAPAAASSQGGGETLLLVEDDAAARELLVEFLESRGFKVLAASSGREALRLAEQHGAAIRLLFTDLGLPDMRGTALAKELSAQLGDLCTIFVSGYTQETMGGVSDPAGRVAFLHKPFRLREAEARIRELLDEGGARSG